MARIVGTIMHALITSKANAHDQKGAKEQRERSSNNPLRDRKRNCRSLSRHFKTPSVCASLQRLERFQPLGVAGLLAYDSINVPPPSQTSPVAFGEHLIAYSCGGSHGFGPLWVRLTMFPFHSARHNCQAKTTLQLLALKGLPVNQQIATRRVTFGFCPHGRGIFRSQIQRRSDCAAPNLQPCR